VVEDGKIRKRRVKVGVANWDQTQVKDGLKAGELVVVPTDRKKLLEGLEVRPETRSETPAERKDGSP
jgi:HlyD family secretion protein